MLGKGWFPDQVTGLDRYFRELFDRQPESRALVVGPADGAPARLYAAGLHDTSLLHRIWAIWRASRTAAEGVAVVDVHFALYAILPMLLGPLRSIPVMVHFHGPWAEENVAAGDSSRLRRAARVAIERFVYGRAQRLVVLSSAFKRVLVETYRVAPWGVRVDSPGVDLDRFSPDDQRRARGELGLSPDAFVAVTVRRLVPRAGVDLLIDAWARALPDLPAGAVLLIVGEGQEDQALRERVDRLALSSSVRLVGRITDARLIDAYRAGTVAVVPSRSFEGFGLVVLEAAACGTPSIVTQVGGLPEAVNGLDPSLTVAANDTDAIRQRLVAASQPDGLPSRSSTRLFAERHSWNDVVARDRATVREITGRPRARRTRVVYLDHTAQMSGGEIALLRILPHMRDIEAHVILAEDGPLVAQLERAGISAEVFALRGNARLVRKDNVQLRGLNPGVLVSTADYIVRLAAYLRRIRPDVVHLNSLKAGVYGSLAARLARLPVVWHVHDRITSDYLPSTAVKLIRWLARHLAARTIASSQLAANTLSTSPDPVVIPYALPQIAIRRPTRVAGDRSLVVGMVGRIAPWKGQDLFLRAFAEAFPTCGRRCVIVGSALFGEDQHWERVHEEARRLEIADRVEFRGFRDDVWSELARMDILVHASLTPEPFGQVIVEGMAAGVPVIAANAGGPTEIVSHDVDGILYPMGNQAALADAMKRLADDPARRRRLAAEGRRTATRYLPDGIAASLSKVYEDVLRGAER